jgi:PEP-CTERM motif
MRFARILQMVGLVALFTGAAHAGRIELADRGSINYPNSGQFWFTPESGLTLTLNSFFLPLDFGSGAPAQRFIKMDPKGQIIFTDSVGNPTGDYIAPMLSATAYRADPNFLSAIFINTGTVAPAAIDATRPITYDPSLPTYDPSQDLNAVRFWWNSVCTANSPCDGSGNATVDFQAVLVGLGNDSFLLQYNYGFNGSAVPRDASASFSLGGTTRTFAGPYDQVGPDYCFNHGAVSVFTTISACTGTITSTVPEPATVALLFAGLFAVMALRSRRRVMPARHIG